VNNIAKNIAIWIAIALVLMTVFQQFGSPDAGANKMVYSQFMSEVKNGNIAKVQIDGRNVTGTTRDSKKFSTYAPNDLWMVSDLLKYNVEVEAKAEEQRSLFVNRCLDFLYAPNARWRERWRPILIW